MEFVPIGRVEDKLMTSSRGCSLLVVTNCAMLIWFGDHMAAVSALPYRRAILTLRVILILLLLS